MSEREFGRLIRDDGWRPSSLVRWPTWLRAQGLHDALLIGGLYLLWLAAAYAINLMVSGARTPQQLFDQWVRFDGIYFRALAQYGYAEASRLARYQQGFAFLTAFFPLFPLLINLAAPLFALNF